MSNATSTAPRVVTDYDVVHHDDTGERWYECKTITTDRGGVLHRVFSREGAYRHSSVTVHEVTGLGVSTFTASDGKHSVTINASTDQGSTNITFWGVSVADLLKQVAEAFG